MVFENLSYTKYTAFFRTFWHWMLQLLPCLPKEVLKRMKKDLGSICFLSLLYYQHVLTVDLICTQHAVHKLQFSRQCIALGVFATVVAGAVIELSITFSKIMSLSIFDSGGNGELSISMELKMKFPKNEILFLSYRPFMDYCRQFIITSCTDFLNPDEIWSQLN